MTGRARTVLLAWEAGGGLGHVVALRELARRLAPHGVKLVVAVKHLLPAASLAEIGVEVLQSPLWPQPDDVRLPGGVALSFADILAKVGVGDAAKLRMMLVAWRGLLDRIKPDLLVADYAPGASLAARGRMPVVQTSPSFCLPPHGLESFPPLLRGRPSGLNQAGMLATINRELETAGITPLSGLGGLFSGEAHIVRTFPVLDIYASLRQEPAVGPISDFVPSPRSPDGRTIFAYLNRAALRTPQIRDALMPLAPRLRISAPGLRSSQFLADLERNGARIEHRFLPLGEPLATGCLFIHHGNAGVAAEALAAGVPQLALAPDLEKLLNGRLLAHAGVGQVIALGPSVPQLTAVAVEALSEDTGVAARAAEVGQAHRAILREDPGGKLERACLSLLTA